MCMSVRVNHGHHGVFPTGLCLPFYSHKGRSGLHVLCYSLFLEYRLGDGVGVVAVECPILGAVALEWSSLFTMPDHP